MDREKTHIKGLKNGSYKDFTQLYKIYAPRLYAFIYKLVRSESVSKDIVQETFTKVWENRKNIDTDLSFKSYIFTIARNHLLNEFRNHIYRIELTGNTETFENNRQAEYNDTEEQYSLTELKELLQQAKLKLTPRQRELFELNREKGLSINEVVEQTGISEQSVRNQLSQAIQRLRKEMRHVL